MIAKRPSREILSAQQSQPLLTIIIPTLNERTYLPGLLTALDNQSQKADEIIVADAGSDDGTAELAKKRGARVIRGGMPAVGRNAGAREAKGRYLLFLDADVVPPPDFIANLVSEFEERNYDVATCFISALEDHPLDRAICHGTNLYFRVIQPVSPHAPGFCILSKRAKHEELGGFDETLALSEDIDYARRAKRIGRFGFITRTRIPVSMRRVGKEGLLGIGLKYAWCELYAFAGRPVRKAPFAYEFGKFEDKELSTQRPAENSARFPPPLQKIGKPILRVGNLIREQFDR